MNYIIALFSNRNSTLRFYNMLTRLGVRSSVISTPKIPGFNCGVCVKLNKNDYNLATNLLYRSEFSDFLGFYEIKKDGEKLYSVKI
ncbi:MAG: DUF3343 domain-containing protein [Clostridia bacterium]|nr:DUF3343 domain-containing protein [Clostridia bacterium]